MHHNRKCDADNMTKRITINLNLNTYDKLKLASENINCSMSALVSDVLDITVDDILNYSLKCKEADQMKNNAREIFINELKGNKNANFERQTDISFSNPSEEK